MIESATGVILRTQRLTETSLIVRWLTRDLGRLSTVAKGARRPKSSFAGKLDLFVQADLSFSRNRRSDLHTLRELVICDAHLPIRTDLQRLNLAAHGVALIEQTTETNTPLPGIYELFTDYLTQLSQFEARPRLVFAFELKLLGLLGLTPSLSKSNLKPAARKLANDLTSGSWEEIQSLKATAAQVKELNAFLHGFLIYHLGKIPRTRGQALTSA